MRTIKKNIREHSTSSKITNSYTFASRLIGTGAAGAADPCWRPLGRRAPWWVTL